MADEKTDAGQQIGLTEDYNLFHDPACRDADIAELRRLHVQIDTTIRNAYGLCDRGHDFHGDGKERATHRPCRKAGGLVPPVRAEPRPHGGGIVAGKHECSGKTG